MSSQIRSFSRSIGCSWLDQLPDEWEVMPIKYLAIGESSYFDDGDWIESKDIADSGIRYLTTGNVGQGVFKIQGSGFISEETFKSLGCKYVYPGDLLISRLNLPMGRACIVPRYEEKYVTAVDNVIFRPKKGISKHYLLFLFSCAPYFAHMKDLARGSTMVRVSRTILGNVRIPIPEYSEQIQIATYLNRETAKIDKLITKQQKLIKLLQEKRQAVISQAVTKGLDQNVKMKDSGVEWLGDVPEHWDIKKVSLLFRCRKGTNAAVLTKEFCSTIEGPFPVYSGQTSNNGVMASINTYEFDAGPEGVLFSTTVGAKAMTVMHIMGKFSLSQNCMIIAPIKNALVRYYFYAFQPLFRFERGLIPEHMQASFRMEDLYGYRIPCPPDVEMTAIVNMLEVFNAKTEQLIDKAKNSINLLTEHRQALITAAVTGKIDVRGLVTDEEVAALDADPVLETKEEYFESEVAEADYITEEE